MSKRKILVMLATLIFIFGITSITIAGTPITPTVTITGWEYGTYNSGTNSPSVTGNAGGGNITYEYKLKNALDSTYVQTIPQAVGDYTVRASIEAIGDYDAKTAVADFSITKRIITLEKTVIKERSFKDNNNILDDEIGTPTFNIDNTLITYTQTAEFSESKDKYAGTNKTADVTVTLSEDSFVNYAFTGGLKSSTVTSAPFDIVTKAVEIIARPSDIVNVENTSLMVVKGEAGIDLSDYIKVNVDELKDDLTYQIDGIYTGASITGSTLSVTASAALGTINILITSRVSDINTDLPNEYSNATKNIYVKVISKENVIIDGLTYTNREYNENAIEPTGVLTVSNNSVPVNELEVNYIGINGTVYDSATPPTNVGKYRVKYSVPTTNSDYTGSKTYDFEITQAVPQYTSPTGLTGVKGGTLSSVTLPSNFTWNAPTTALTVGSASYIATYTPIDAINYKTITNVSIPVYTKDIFTINASVTGDGGRILTLLGTVTESDNFDITFTLEDGYSYDEVLVNGVDKVEDINGTKLTLINVTENKTIEAKFKTKTNVTIGGLNYASKVYNGNVIVPTGRLTVTENKVATSQLVVRYEGREGTIYSSTMAPKNAGKYKAVWRVPLTNKTYMGSVDYDFEITKAAPVITGKKLSQTVGSINPVTYTITPTVTDGTVTVQYEISSVYGATLPTAVGKYNVKIIVAGDSNIADGEKIEQLVISKSSGGGGSSSNNDDDVIEYRIKVETSTGGKITPNTVYVERGDDQKFKITPNTGYEIDSVIVDDKNVGAVKTYTFENVKAKHTITAEFKKKSSGTIVIPNTPTTQIPPIQNITWQNPFKDVKEKDWYYQPIQYVNERGLLKGVKQDEFGPKVIITRGMLATILYNHAGSKAFTTKTSTFSDVDKSAYYSSPIAWAADNNIVGGIGNNMYAPNEGVTREQAVTMLYRYAKYIGKNTSITKDISVYEDSKDVSDFAKESFKWSVGSGIISGKTNKTLAPKEKANRAEFSTMLMKFLS